MDVIWFKLSRPDQMGTGNMTGGVFGTGTMLAMLDRGSEMQIGYVILKGSYKSLREAGIPALQEEIKKLAPQLEQVLPELKEWSQCAILSVVTGRVDQWFKPGLLLIGDAAHVMSPVGGVGINYAIQDAVAAANILTTPLLEQRITTMDLADVQHRRERPVRFIQSIQSLIQKQIIAGALKGDKPFQPPLPVRIMTRFRFFRKIMARTMAYGLDPQRVENV